MRHLIALISTKEKTSQQSTQEVMAAFQKYEKVQVESQLGIGK